MSAFCHFSPARVKQQTNPNPITLIDPQIRKYCHRSDPPRSAVCRVPVMWRHVQCWRRAAVYVVTLCRRLHPVKDCCRASCRQRPAVGLRAHRGWSALDQPSVSTSPWLTSVFRRLPVLRSATPASLRHAFIARSLHLFSSCPVRAQEL